jgi:DUF1009 family protein
MDRAIGFINFRIKNLIVAAEYIEGTQGVITRIPDIKQ